MGSMAQTIPVAEYGVEPVRRPWRMALRVVLLALGGWLVLSVVLFGLRYLRLPPARPAPAAPAVAPVRPVPAAPATSPA
jgi:hypothetical protein